MAIKSPKVLGALNFPYTCIGPCFERPYKAIFRALERKPRSGPCPALKISCWS